MMDYLHVSNLIKKYDVPVPRYTSYPTVPFWDQQGFTLEKWEKLIKKAFDASNHKTGISLYIHLPFCESLCTYCACNTRITKNHGVEERYITAVLAEWEHYKKMFGDEPIIRELHLGGGTPTFFSPGNLKKLLEGIYQGAKLHPQMEFSVEGHPNNTTQEHLEALYALHFRRVSFGVQDLSPKVQQAINRIQTFEQLEKVTRISRQIGYGSVSFDLVYGLPYQGIDQIKETVSKVITLKPDRIAFYSYAHVPWMRPGQRGYEDADIPTDVEKRALYETGKAMLEEAGYTNIGMDHFALPGDDLYKAFQKGTLHRNFMGYTVTHTEVMVGLGASSIGDAKYAYSQNLKKVEDYEAKVLNGEWPVFKGHIQTHEDMLVRKAILALACKGKVDRTLLEEIMDESMFHEIGQMHEEGLVRYSSAGLTVTPLGRVFVRNICRVFDLRMQKEQPVENLFSRAI